MAEKTVLVLFAYPKGVLMGVPYEGYIDALMQYRVNDSYAFDRSSLKEMRFIFKDAVMDIVDPVHGKSLKDYGAIYFRFWRNFPQQAKAVALFARANKVPFISTEVERVSDSSKLAEYAVMSQHGLPLIDSFCSSNKQIKKVFKTNPPIPFPLIVKSISGSLGNNNHLVESYAELEAVLNDNPDSTFIAQQFVDNDYDLRIVILGGKPATILRRSRTSGHLNNTSKGGKGGVVAVADVDPHILEIALDAAKSLGRSDFCGVDIVVEKASGKPYVLEVNRTPQIETGAEIGAKTSALNQYLNELMEA